MPGRRACRWKVDLVAVVISKSFADLRLIVSLLIAGDEEDRKATARRYLHARVSVQTKGATDLGKAEGEKVVRIVSREMGEYVCSGFTCQSRRNGRREREGRRWWETRKVVGLIALKHDRSLL